MIQANAASASGSASEVKLETGAGAAASPVPAVKDAKKTGTPVTIQPAPGQSSLVTSGTSTTSPGKTTSGRGNSHYPNVIPQSQLSQPTPQQPQWAKNTFPVTKSKPQTSSSQAQVIPTPPLPLPGPTFRAWPVTAAPPPPPIGYAFGTFPGVAGSSVAKGNGTAQVTAPVQRTGSASASATPSPVSNANPATTANANRGATGVQRANLNHYPGPMRYQPYPIAATNPGGVSKGKPILPQRTTAPGLVKVAPSSGIVSAQTAATSTTPLPKLPLPRNSSGQFASWTGEKGKK
jgi:hypothetical protein